LLSVACFALCQAGLNEKPVGFLKFCCVDGEILGLIYASLQRSRFLAILVCCSYLFLICSRTKISVRGWLFLNFCWLSISYRFLIKKCNCTADKHLNWHRYIQQHDQAWMRKLSFCLSQNFVYLLYLCPILDIRKINEQRCGLALFIN